MKEDDALGTVAVDGEDYHWKVRHDWLVNWGVGLKGISISVWREPGRTRELILDFPFSVFGLDRSPERSDLISALRPAVKAAITGGWKPGSRGRAFRFDVPDLQSD